MSRIPSRTSFLLALLLATASLAAQDRRPLTHDDYDQWKSLRGQTELTRHLDNTPRA